MGGRRKEPIELIKAKGKKHLTKAEIEKRKAEEVKVDLVNVTPPDYLTPKQKEEFLDIAWKLEHIKIMTELDEEALARYITTNEEYKKIDKKLQMAINSPKFDIAKINNIQIVHDKLLKQVRSLAADLGLTITSRARLVVPIEPEKPKENKFSKFGGKDE